MARPLPGLATTARMDCFRLSGEQNAIRERYGVTEDYRFRSSGHDKQVALSSMGGM